MSAVFVKLIPHNYISSFHHPVVPLWGKIISNSYSSSNWSIKVLQKLDGELQAHCSVHINEVRPMPYLALLSCDTLEMMC